GPTIYPVLFAALIGRALKSIAFWKLQRGSKIGTLDRVLGSMTIVQTVLTQVQMRSLSLLGFLLIVIWSLSPLGGQASLRIIRSNLQANDTIWRLQYVNTSSNVLTGIYEGADTASQFVPVNALFGAALVGASSSSSSSVDAWGNIKIPWIERLNTTWEDAEGCMYDYNQSWDSPVNTRLRHITYMENNNGPAHWVAANCTIRTTYVEVNVFCATGSCTGVKMRKSRRPCSPESWTVFDVAGSAFYWFSPRFVGALPAGHSVVASPYQNFILNPENPFPTSFNVPPVTTVSNSTFALRLGQLLNTFWMAMLAPTAVPKGLRNSNLTADTAEIGTVLSNTTVTETQTEFVLECDTFWFVVLLLSSGVTAVIGLCGLVAAMCSRGPDISFNISSLIKDSPFFDQTNVATTLSGTDRSVLMKDWYAKYGDVAAEDEVGYIAIGSGNVADLQTGRLYR
ncbi:uncharacterized protein M437DRAFT_40911, partial [Aureobasidium melanogenum CBS 110374]